MTQMFVYGTLQPGEINYGVCAEAVVEARPAIVRGHLYHLPMGYPALTLETQTVRGFLLTFANPGIVQRLDEFERHDPIVLQRYVTSETSQQYEYERGLIQVFDLEGRSLGTAWSYLMTIEQIQKIGGIPVSAQQWNGRQF